MFDLRVGYFVPGVLVPLEAYPTLIAALLLLLLSNFSLTIPNTSSLFLRLAVTPVACILFWRFGFGPYETPERQVSVGMAVIGLYGLMRIFETNIVSLLDHRPPLWVKNGKELALPEKFTERLVYALDLTTSLRGNSWLKDRSWVWAPRALQDHRYLHVSRGSYLRKMTIEVVSSFLVVDVLDTINKSRIWDLTIVDPITSLSVPEQLIFSLSVCIDTALAINITYGLTSMTAVALGSSPASWPPMFNSPLSASSLADFWTRRWHAVFRRVFDRISSFTLRTIPPLANLPNFLRNLVRGVIIFALSTTLHVMVMYRLDFDNREENIAGLKKTLDPSILKFFLSQPLGLAIESFFIIPLSKLLFTEKYQSTGTRIWAWCFMLWGGRYWSDVWVHRGLWHENEYVVGYSLVRGLIWGKWTL